jgi:molecular chaperone IbpA
MNIDFAPLFRSTVGFDRLARLMENETPQRAGYPPYNIERTGEDAYRITVAVAGFRPEELDLQLRDNSLILTGQPAAAANPETQYLHHGIAGRAFERRFVLAEHMVVEHADLRDGLLYIDLKRLVPEALRPRAIEIKTAPQVLNS